MGMGKKVSRLKADMANDLLVREINEHQFKVKIRILEENNRVLRRRLWVALATGIVLGFLAGLCLAKCNSHGFVNGCTRAIGKGVAKGLCGIYG